jgi:integrase
MATLPRGILAVQHSNKDGTVTKKYRVRIVRKDFKCDQRFDDLQEAKEFLALSKAKRGKEIIYNITEKELQNRQIDNDPDNYTFGYYIDRYLDDYVLNQSQDTELQKRNVKNILSFYKTIRNTSIIDENLTYQDKEEMGLDGDMPVPIFMYAWDIRKINYIEINHYIKERLKTVKPSSVSREISHISNVFNKARYFNKKLEKLENPTRYYDKGLLKNRNPKREFSITQEEEERFFKLLSERDNQQLYKIAKISVLTSLRRSEIVTLTFSQIKDNYIQLTHTKSGKPRKVYMDAIAKAYLSTMERQPDSDRLFRYTVAGFDRMFRHFTKKHNLAHIHFHDLRRIAISRKIMQIGAENSVFISEFLGIQSVKKLEIFHIDKQAQPQQNQQHALYSFGHSFPQTTKGYFNMNINKK